MDSELHEVLTDCAKLDGGTDDNLWTEETIDIETPFSNMNQDHVEYLKLEIAELKQILISLAEKYKLSEDRRKVAERRNSFLKADNMRLQQISDTSISQKIEAEVESRRTLDKLREFIEFKHAFEKQADLLKKIISHFPKMKNASTSTNIQVMEKSEQCNSDRLLVDYLNSNKLPLRSYDDSYYMHDDSELYRSLKLDSTDDSGFLKKKDFEDEPTTTANLSEAEFIEPCDTLVQNPESENMDKSHGDGIEIKKLTENSEVLKIPPTKLESSNQIIEYPAENYTELPWEPKSDKDITSDPSSNITVVDAKSTKSKMKLSQLQQEVLALKNLNEWKTSDLEYKNRQLAIKDRELHEAKKEITQLNVKVSKLLVDHQKRPATSFVSRSPIKIEAKCRTASRKEANKTKNSNSMVAEDSTKKRNQAIEAVVRAETNKLPLSTESVWQEIAPGDNVRIKMKKQIT